MKTLWHKHPGVRSGDKLDISERSADAMKHGMGSWTFVFSFLTMMAVYATLNTFAWVHHWDPYPFILLNLFLSMMAGLQGAIILIAGNRAEQQASEEAHHTLKNTELLKVLVQQNTELTEQVHTLIAKGNR